MFRRKPKDRVMQLLDSAKVDASSKIHLKLKFNSFASEISLIFAVNDETLEKARIWAAEQPDGLKLSDLGEWLRDNSGRLDSVDDQPALMLNNCPDGSKWEEWRTDGYYDRANGPALVMTDEDGSRQEVYYKMGALIRSEFIPP